MPDNPPGAVLDINFEWPLCTEGYKSQRPKVKPPPAPRPKGPPETLLENELREDDTRRIKPKGKSERLYRPFEFHPTLYAEFAQLDGLLDSCLGFANRFGLLGFPQSKGGEPLYDWQRAITGMADAIKLWQTDPLALKDRLTIGSLHGSLEPVPPDGRLVFRLRPSSLHHGMQLQLVQAIGSGLTLKECEFCGRWFEAGGIHRRRDARFCSKEHKIDFHNLEKRRVKK